MKTQWFKAEKLLPAVVKKIQNVNVVLDIGCGIMPQKYIRPMVHICCEPFTQYVEKLQKKITSDYDREYIIIQAGWKKITEIIPEKSVDTVFLIDVIEHLEKEEGERLLKKTERIARNQIVIFTPLGYISQSHPEEKDAWGMNGSVWQEHKSGWLPEDFVDGWDIFACKDYHKSDNMGKLYKKPKGAFWAIKTIKSKILKYEIKRKSIHNFIEILENISNEHKMNNIYKIATVSSNIDNSILFRLNIFILKILVKISNLFKK